MPPDILDNLTSGGRVRPEPSAMTDMPLQQPQEAPEPASESPPADGGSLTPPSPAEPIPEPVSDPGAHPDAKVRREQRFADLTRQRREAEERAAKAVDAVTTLSEQNRQLMERIEHIINPPRQEPPVEVRPTREGYSSPEEYDAALVEYASRKAVREATAEWERKQAEARRAEEEHRVAAEQQSSQQQIIETWQQRRAAAIEKYPDFAEIAEGEVPITVPMRDAILSLEEGAEVAYHLGKNPHEAADIAKLGPVQQIAAIGRIAARLTAPPPPVVPPVNPPPINPLRGGDNPPPLNPDEDKNYMERRLQQLRSERTPGGVGMIRPN